MINNFKKNKYFYLFLGGFILSFVYNFFLFPPTYDEIWNYGFAYNISSGLIPYRDFNMVITPFYAFLVSIFIKLLGNYIIVMHIFNSIVVALLLLMFYKKLGKKFFIIVPLLIISFVPGYSSFSLFIFFLFLYFDDYEFKYKNILLGLLVAIMFLTKQTIGISLVIPYIYYSKDKIKSIISFLIPIIIFLIYLIYNNAFYNFFDYCFLGLFEFGTENKYFQFLFIEIIVCVIFLYKLIKSKFKNRILFYILMFQIITIPICDFYHFIWGMLPIVFYLCTLNFNSKKIFLYMMVISYSFLFLFGVSIFNSNYNLAGKSFLFGRALSKNIVNDLNDVSDYIDDLKDYYDNYYFLGFESYLIKLYVGDKVNKYDLINNGNMGYKGDLKYINELDETCKKEGCVFLINKSYFINKNYDGRIAKDKLDQVNYNIIKYVVDNYGYIDDVFNFYVFSR